MSTDIVPSLDETKAAIEGASPDLSVEDQQIAVATYRVLSRGKPASPSAIAGEADTSIEAVEERLSSWGAVFRSDEGDVFGFWGLATVEMPHRLEVDGRRLYAWCAWDPLFLANIIGDMTVSTDDPTTGAEIRYRIENGTVLDSSHSDAVLSFMRPDQPWDDAVMATFCHHVLHFESRDTADQWIGDHPDTFALTLADAVAVAEHHVQRTFGNALQTSA